MVTEAGEKHWEEQKRLEEKVQLVTATKLAVELEVGREQRILLQVSLSFLWVELEV